MTATEDRMWRAIHQKHGGDLVLGRAIGIPIFSTSDAVLVAAAVADQMVAEAISERETVTAALLAREQRLRESLQNIVDWTDSSVIRGIAQAALAAAAEG